MLGNWQLLQTAAWRFVSQEDKSINYKLNVHILSISRFKTQDVLPRIGEDALCSKYVKLKGRIGDRAPERSRISKHQLLLLVSAGG